MRTGAEYREALRDGRKVWIVGAGLVTWYARLDPGVPLVT
jgi:type IV secretory pathway TrbD component